jgi:hypothetical protein
VRNMRVFAVRAVVKNTHEEGVVVLLLDLLTSCFRGRYACKTIATKEFIDIVWLSARVIPCHCRSVEQKV